MSKKVKFGIIGVGHMGQYHVNVGKQLSSAELIGVYDADPARAKFIAEQHNTRVFAQIADMLKEVEAVIISAPTFLHYEISKQALEAGKHVLVEKPISETVEQARELVKIAADKKLTFQVGHIERFNGAILQLGKVATAPIHVESRRLAPYNARIKDVGVVLDMMIHDIDIVLNLVKSDVVSVKAVGSKVVSDHEDVASVVLKFANGSIASINASRATQAKIRTLNVTQKDNYIKLDFTDQDIEIHRQASSDTVLGNQEITYKQESIVEKVFVYKDNPLKQQHEHFMKCIMGMENPLVAGESDIKTLEVAHKVLEQIQQQ